MTRGIGGLFAVLAAIGCGGRSDSAAITYPTTRTVNVVDDYHGTKVPDPYRWLEDTDSKEVKDWAAAQSALSAPLLRTNDIWPKVFKRVEELAVVWDGFPEPPTTPPLIDPKEFGPDAALDGAWPSPDRKHLVYAVSIGGSEWVDTRIRRLADGKDLEERLEGLLWAEIRWTKDSRGFFYERAQRPANAERTMLRAPAVFYHRVGTPQSEDLAIFRTPQDATDIVVDIDLSDDGRFLFVYEGNAAHVEGLGWLLTRIHTLDLGNPSRPVLTNPLVPLTSRRDAAYRVVATRGDTWLVWTDRDAPRRKLVEIDRRRPSPDQWREVIPQAAEVLEGVRLINGRLVTVHIKDVQHRVRVFERDGRLIRELAIPPYSNVLDVRPGNRSDELIVETTAFLTPPARTRHNLTTGEVTMEKQMVAPVNAADMEFTQVWYRGKDHVRIPMYLVHRRGLVKDGKQPTLLAGYGASSTAMLPAFSEHLIAWVEMGGVVAMPALRGGGEFGRDWYEAAILERKQTTFDDFIAAAEFLIAEKYTSAAHLAIQGRSNGGLLVAAVITQRPELFRVAIAEVPSTDALRYDRGRHSAQFGSAKDPAQFPFLFAYSPQHRIRPGTCYPATLVTTAMNDDRAASWMALKFAAALQAAQSCGRPVLLRADTAGGHFGDFASDGTDALVFAALGLGAQAPAGWR